MKIIEERVEGEIFIDLVLTAKELDDIYDFCEFSKEIYILGKPVNLGIYVKNE